jgi:transcriptional regulator of acetoin/glycerol metabolism
MRVDLVRELINRLIEASGREGTLTESIAREVERQFRHDYSGAECVISRRPLPDETRRQEIVRQALEAPEKPMAEIASENGISRASLYRYLKR